MPSDVRCAATLGRAQARSDSVQRVAHTGRGHCCAGSCMQSRRAVVPAWYGQAGAAALRADGTQWLDVTMRVRMVLAEVQDQRVPQIAACMSI